MNEQITDEKTNIRYTLQGAYYQPDFTSPTEEEQPIGIWGRGCPGDTSTEDRSTDRAGRRDRAMNNIQNRVTEIVNNYLIYS